MTSKIKETREALGLSQKEARILIGAPARTWEDWEAGRRRPPEYIENLIIEKLQTSQKNKAHD